MALDLANGLMPSPSQKQARSSKLRIGFLQTRLITNDYEEVVVIAAVGVKTRNRAVRYGQMKLLA